MQNIYIYLGIMEKNRPAAQDMHGERFPLPQIADCTDSEHAQLVSKSASSAIRD